MAVNMFITPTVLLAFPDFVSYGAPSKIMIEDSCMLIIAACSHEGCPLQSQQL